MSDGAGLSRTVESGAMLESVELGRMATSESVEIGSESVEDAKVSEEDEESSADDDVAEDALLELLSPLALLDDASVIDELLKSLDGSTALKPAACTSGVEAGTGSGSGALNELAGEGVGARAAKLKLLDDARRA